MSQDERLRSRAFKQDIAEGRRGTRSASWGA
jgi:hypothetical protein